MKFILVLALISSLTLTWASVSQRRPEKRYYDTHDYFVLEYDPSFNVPIEDAALTWGLEVVEPAGELQDYWLARKPKSTVNDLKAWQSSSFAHLKQPSEDNELYRRGEIESAIKRIHPQSLRQRTKRSIPSDRAPPPVLAASSARSIAERLGIDDPLFPDQWHLVNEEFPEHMMNATPVWDMGITGEGIVSALVDDGLQWDSDDLAENFDAFGSYDYNNHVELPTPMLWDDNHGTRCAGQIAAVKNTACGVGIAYKSKVAGIRILSGPISDVDEAAALNYGYQNTSIYSCSWGPTDDGRSMEGPTYLIEKAILNGIQKGRQGKGSIFVFASGNGAHAGDQCNFDGYVNSIYTLTVAAIDYKGQHTTYSESCAANMIVAYTSGSNPDKGIVTTDRGQNACTKVHGGTSAAAPNAVGVVALALSVRSDLTWRDVQHIAVKTADIVNADDPGWELTATGRPYNYKFGFGKIDAYQFVTTAQSWVLVKPQAWLELPPVQIANGSMTAEGVMTGGELIPPEGLAYTTSITQKMLNDNNFEALEHVTVRVWISHDFRGDVEAELISPAGIRSMLARKRPADSDAEGFPGWRFMSVKHWSENPLGVWTLRINDQNVEDRVGRVLGWSLSLWGSSIDPEKATHYELPNMDDVAFPAEPDHAVSSDDTVQSQASTTKSYGKPTVIPTMSLNPSTLSSPEATSAPTDNDEQPVGGDLFDDEPAVDGTSSWQWVSDSTQYIGERKGAVGSSLVFLILIAGVLLYLARRRQLQAKQQYLPVSNQDEMRMGRIGLAEHGSAHTDAGDLAGDSLDPMLAPSVEDFHSSFLDDDEEHLNSPQYKDFSSLRTEPD